MYNRDILEVLRPFVEAKVHNPNQSEKTSTTRVLNVKASQIAALSTLYNALSLEAPCGGTEDLTSRLITRVAYQERDSREYYREQKILEEAGCLTQEAQEFARGLVQVARDQGSEYLDVEKIRARIATEYLGDEE